MNWVIKGKHLNADKKLIGLELEDKEGTFDANIRWDGSMEINLKYKTEDQKVLVDTIHTSDIDGLITKLSSLKRTCTDYFEDWSSKKEEGTEFYNEAMYGGGNGEYEEYFVNTN